VIAIGRVGRDFFKKREIPIISELTGLGDEVTFAEIKDLARQYDSNVYLTVRLMNCTLFITILSAPLLKK
jgi:F0F1-type ATP synthase gamma subunit